MLGIIAVGALFIYAIYFFALIKLIPITMTLPGIAGLILTIGVAADANIVIFERVKEEIRAGRSVSAGIVQGYRKGIAAIIDANVVTFMVAFILFILATAGVKGFAFTLGIGTLTSLFTAVLATQAVLGTMQRSPLLGAARRRSGAGETQAPLDAGLHGRVEVVLLDVGRDPAHRRAGHRRQGPELRHRLPVGHARQGRLRAAAERERRRRRAARPRASRTPRSRRSRATRSSRATASRSRWPRAGAETIAKVQPLLTQRFGAPKAYQSNSIGPTFGQTVAKSAIIAIIASLIVISAYIALRFEWKFAVPVLIALMHDLLITAGVYSLTGREVTTSTVAALLTILGYSLYDTIIVFDRIRENVPRMPRAAFTQIVNRSMSEVLTRSLATSFCTLLPILALLFFGGDTLKDFAFALLVGVVSGAYSSVFIASPVLAHWKEREEVYRRRRHRIIAELGGVVPAYATASPRRHGRAARAAAPAAPRSPRPTTPSAASRSASSTRWCATSRTRPSPSPVRTRAAEARARGGPGAPTRAPEDLVLKDAQARQAQARRATSVTGGRASHGHVRLGHDGPGPLALHDLPARPLLGRDRRRVPRRAVRRGHSSGCSSTGSRSPGRPRRTSCRPSRPRPAPCWAWPRCTSRACGAASRPLEL